MTTTSLLDAVPVERIAGHARSAPRPHPGRVALTVILGVLFAAGWLAAKSWAVACWLAAKGWLCVAFAGCAVREGWRDGRRGAD